MTAYTPSTEEVRRDYVWLVSSEARQQRAEKFDRMLAEVRGDSVTPQQIEEQRAKGWPDFHPETYCHRCGRRNVQSWTAPSNLWNEAVGSEGDIICPPCLDQMSARSRHWWFMDDDALAEVRREAAEKAVKQAADWLESHYPTDI
jgi:hypothetical protein